MIDPTELVTRLLLEKGGNAQARTAKDETCLTLAAEVCRDNTLALLLGGDSGGNLWARYRMGLPRLSDCLLASDNGRVESKCRALRGVSA